MSRHAALSSGVAILFLIVAARVFGQETAPGLQEELRALRQVVEQQSRQIESLTQQIAQLRQRLEAQPKTAAPPEPPTPPTVPAEPPKAEPVATGPKHTVAKGETLTSIAKRYNIPIADLQKANEIKDDRKLQIGQVLNIPAPKPSEPSAEKKENP